MKSKMPKLKLTFRPLSADLWSDFEELFGPRGACGGCWCMAWRRPRKEFEAGKSGGNRRVILKLVKADTKPGILAYHNGKAVGWCSVAPREEFDYLARSRVLKPIDDKPVWSVSCLFIAKEYRRRGVGAALLRAAVDFVKKRGGRIVEGYPVIPSMTSMPAVFAWTGTVANFEKAGYTEVARGSPTRPIFRCETSKARRR